MFHESFLYKRLCFTLTARTCAVYRDALANMPDRIYQLDESTQFEVTEFLLLTRETPVVIDGPVGQLEALYLDLPEPKGLALLCHPNPVQGGR